MSNLFASLTTISNGMKAFERSLEISQNNISNAQTPGYARQRSTLEALSFDSEGGLMGGVRAGIARTTRDSYSEKAVQRQLSTLGQFEQRSSILASLNQVLALDGASSIPGTLNALVASFSAWGAAPNSAAARQGVVRAADEFAASVRSTSQQVQTIANETERKLDGKVAELNDVARRIADINALRARTPAADPALDTDLHNTLEDLAKLTNFTVLPDESGVVTILVGGQSPLVMGDQTFPVTGSYSASPSGGLPTWSLLDSQQRDITSHLTTGELRGLADLHNTTLTSLIGGASDPGDLNTFATNVATRINDLLTAGLVTSDPPVTGIPLFSFGSSATDAAASLQINDSVSPSELAGFLAAIQTEPTTIANGVPLALSSLLDGSNVANLINGQTSLAYFGRIASSVGGALQTADTWKTRSLDLLNQAKAMREEISGVSLDVEAAKIIELQRGYQAVARVAGVLDDMMQTVLGMIR